MLASLYVLNIKIPDRITAGSNKISAENSLVEENTKALSSALYYTDNVSNRGADDNCLQNPEYGSLYLRACKGGSCVYTNKIQAPLKGGVYGSCSAK